MYFYNTAAKIKFIKDISRDGMRFWSEFEVKWSAFNVIITYFVKIDNIFV
jgi:hypothetical protein